MQCFAPAKRIPFGAFFGCADAGLPVRGGRGGKVQPIDGGTASGVYWTCVKMREWPSAFAAADYNQNRDPEAKKYGMKRIWNNRSSARGWGKAAAVFTMAMVLAVGGLGAAMNLADLQGAVTVQPIVRQQSGTEPEQKTKLFGKKQTGSAASSEKCAADSTEEPRTAEGPTAQAQPEAAEQPAAQTAESETTAEQGEEPAAAENPAEPAQDTAEEPDPLVPGRAEDAEPDTTESTETAETAQENSPVILQQETPELAAQDPLAAPEETDAAENDLSGRTPEGSMLLTDEQIRKALDEGALDEAEAQCIDLGDENGFFSWLWNWLFGKKDNQEEYTGWLTKNGKTYYYSASTHKPVTGIQSVDGKLYFRIDSRMEPVDLPLTTENRVRGMMALRDCARQLIEYQAENHPDEIIRREQEKLNGLYDAYVKKYGRLYTRGNNLAFSDDSSYPLLCSLEVLDNEGNFARKADMFTKRTIRPHEPVTQVDTASEALAVSLSEKAQVDLGFMSELSGKSEDELVQELSGVIYRNVRCGLTPEEISPVQLDLAAYPYITAEEFLSGNVRKKLRMLQALQAALPAEKKDALAGYLSAMEAVQPTELTAAEIGVRIGASWVPTDVYQQFMFELFGTSVYARQRMRVVRSEYSGEWNISNKSMDGGNIKAVTTYGTKRITAYHILEQTLNQRVVKMFDTVVEDGKERPVLNVKETAIAQDRQELIKSKFADWLWQDIDRRKRLCRIYNDTFNSIRPREYDGSHIRFVGMNPEISLRKHQVNAIAHVLYGGNALLAHEVGAGKTFEIVAAAMEMKRLGLCTKSLIVVPNHITEQWAAEWLQLYPAANILVATERDFEKRNRRRLCARIATGDYDAIIIGHSQLMKIPLSRERQQAILQRQIDEVLLAISDAKRQKAENFTIKQMERTRKSLEARLGKLNDQSTKDDTVTFEELGIDRLFIDESHNFKNLFLMTKMRNVGGIAQTEAQKSSDLFAKCQYLDELTDSHGVIFATGTPISNSMVELYTVQRYLQYQTLQEMGLIHFDDWASDYGETVTAIELSPEGSGYRPKTRFAKFFNLPELMATFKMVADVQMADMLKLPVPKANFHTEVIHPSELQKKAVAGLAERAERVRTRVVDPSTDNMLRITNDGRKLALDMRLLSSLAPDDENSKVSVCARNVYRIWAESTAQRSTQLVFCDLSTPKADGSFNVYDDLRRKLLEMGIPENEIAYIHTANTEQKKKELFAKVRGGEVRILMGSTAKMGAGTNVQDRLIALHDLDCPWRPSDLQQRLGRIVRQGNQNPEVEIFRYVTEGTFDAYLYQLVESKQRFIAQIMTSKAPARAAEDVDETALSYAEIKALATGNPQIIEKCNLDMEVSKLNMLRASHLSQRYALEELVLRKYPAEIKELNERIAGYEQDSTHLTEHPKPAEGIAPMVLGVVIYTERENAGKAIIEACTHMNGAETVSIGSYRGFSMLLSYDGAANEFRMVLKGKLPHTAVLGADAGGNVTRIDNALEKITEHLVNARSQLAHTTEQLENARTEMTAPFPKEAELAEKTRRLNELNVLLNLNEQDRPVMADEPDEGDRIRPKAAERER